MAYRKIFWNMKTSFFGLKFFTYVPTAFLFFPVLAGVPLYLFAVTHSGFQYLDEYDGDVVEKNLKGK